MKRATQFSLSQYIRQNIFLLISTAAALCLFLTVSKLSVLLCAAIFLAVAVSPWIPGPSEPSPPMAGVWIPALVMDLIGAYAFHTTWTQSFMAGVLLARLPFSLKPLIPMLSILGAAAAYYAFYRLSGWMIRLICQFAHQAPASHVLPNLKKNWIFPLSSAAFFLLQASPTPDHLCAAAAAIAIAFVIAIHTPGLFAAARQNSRTFQLLTLLTALGICKFRLDAAGISLFSVLLFAAGLPFVFVCLCFFFRTLGHTLREVDAFRTLHRKEAALYVLLLVIFVCLTGAVYCNTGVFSLTSDPYDILYTGDFPLLVNDDVCLDLTHLENDLRQPLFAVFSAPFTGIAYLLASLPGVSLPLHALLMNIPQIAVLLLSNFLLADLLGLSGRKRISFMLLLCCTYPMMLFSLMMEQYIFTYFYVIVFFSGFCALGTGRAMPYWGAGGTLLTGALLLPLTAKSPMRQFRHWFREMLEGAMGFVLVLLAFGRADIIFNIAANVEKLTAFSGARLTLTEKLLQYTVFPACCFTAPAAQIIQNPWSRISWQLVPAESVHWAGVVILLLCAVSVFLNRKQRSTQACAGWICFSFLILIGLGWGTQENGLILYALYFGWAFWVLLYQLAQTLCRALHRPELLPLLTAAAFVVLLAVNLPAMAGLVRFLLTNYPL